MAAEAIAGDVAADIIASIIKKAATQAQYVFSFNNFVETLEKEKQKLMAKQIGIEEDAVRAHRRAETIDAEVQKWLEVAENLKKEVDELQQQIHMHKAAWCCPNFIQRYRLGRRVEKKTEQLTQLKGECTFRVFASLATLQGMKYYSSEGFISFESRKRVHDQIMEALKDDGIHRIGVHGMGGCGKTTLVKEVGKEAEKLGLFEKVLFVVVSNNPDIRKIQDSLAGSLDFEFKTEKTEPERARRLTMLLSERGRILVILDDVWQKLNFEDIGIPNNCYILLTTRELSVCNTMECQQKVSLLLLNEAEAWNLFQNCAGITEENFDTFKALGQEITNECNGLPVAIAAVAGSLKGKELVDWKDTRDKLRDSKLVDIEPGLRNPYKCLQVSYDNIVKAEFKLLFLLCSLFPEDFEIPEELLIRFAMGVGLFGKIHSNERTRNQMSVAINKLVGSCLLLNGDKRNTIKMHDLIHDIALQIANTENNMIVAIEGCKEELKEHLNSNDSQIRYLWCKMDKFPNQLNCPKLELLFFIKNPGNQLEIPEEIFKGKKELRVLALINEYYFNHPILQLSKSIQSLTNLRYLYLEGWQLDDMSSIGSLVKIESLKLHHCSFHELPDGLANLKNLRLLDMVGCRTERNPYEVIKRCLQLEELYFVMNEWRDIGENRVEFPGKLQRYHIEIGRSIELFPYEDYSTKRYLSIIDDDTQFSTATVDALIRRAEVLYLGRIHKGCTSIVPAFVQKIGEGMNDLAKFIVQNSDELECVVDMTKSFYQDGAVFSNLTHLMISQLQKLESLFLGQPYHDIFQKLEELHISECNQLKHLIANEPGEIVSDGDNTKSYNAVFPKLKLIAIRECQKLEYLMPTSFAQGLLKLENLDINGASQLKYLFSQSNLEDEGQICNQNQNAFHLIKFEALESLTLEGMPNFMLLDLEFRQQDHTIPKNGIFCNLTKLKFIGLEFLGTFFVDPLHVAGFGKLEEISIYRCSQLKHLIANDAEKINSDGTKPRSYNSIFPKVKVISIYSCDQLEYLMPVSFAEGLLQLEKLGIEGCSRLKYAFGQSNYEVEDSSSNQNLNKPNPMMLPALKDLKLASLQKIVSICSESYYLVCPPMNSLELQDCPQLNIMPNELKSRQPDHTITKNEIFCNLTNLCFDGLDWLETLFVGGLKKLKAIRIERCNHLKHLIPNDVEKVTSHGENSLSYNLVFSKLKEITIKDCHELEYLMPISFATNLLQLEKVEISDASQLKYVFGPSNHKAEDQFCNQNLNELHIIRLQALKILLLWNLPNIMNICPETYYPIWPSLDSLELMRCPKLNIKPIKNCIIDLELRQQHHTITKELGAAMLSNVQNLKSLSVNDDDEVDGIFHLQGLPMDGQQVTAGLIDLNLNSLRELKHIWSGPKQFLSLQNLQRMFIFNCGKLEVVFSASILRSLNQLKMLQITECQELHQIFEVDEKNKDQSNPDSEQVWLPELTALIVQQCNKLKCLFSFTTSIELPKLKFIIIKEASELEEVITCDEKGDNREQLQVKFPELEHVVLVQLPKLREVYRGVELQTVRHRVVYHCPKLSLMSSATLENLKKTYKDYYDKARYGYEYAAIWETREIVRAAFEMMEEESKSGSIEEKERESNQENPTSKETMIAPLSVHLEQSNKGRVDESPTFDDVILTHAKSTSSQQTAAQPLTTSASFNWLKEKEDHSEELGNVSKNKHHQKYSLAGINPFPEPSATMPETLSGMVQLEEKSYNWGKFLTLSLFSGPQMVEESPLEKTTSHQIVPEKLDSAVGQIIEETVNKIVQKSPVLAKSEEKASSIELVQNAPMNEPFSVAEDKALEQKKVSTSSQLSFSVGVPLPISIFSPTSRYFSNKSNTEVTSGDHILGGFYLNKPPKEFFEAIKQSSASGPLVLLQNPSPQSNRGRIEEVNTKDANLVTSTKAKTTCSLLDLPQEFTTFSAEAPPPISTLSPTSLYFSNTPNVKVDILGGFDLNNAPKEFFEVIEQKIQVITTSSNDAEFTTRPSPSSSTIPLRSSASLELLDEQPMSGPKMMDKEELEETQILFQTSTETNRIMKTVEASDQEGPKSSKGSDEEVPIFSKATNPVPSLLQEQISGSQTKTYVVEDVEELKDDDLVGLLQSMEEDSDTRAPILLISEIAAKNLTLEDNLVAKALADLQVSLEVPLKDIASNEAASLRLENALNFLSCHSFQDDVVSYELKASIGSLRQEFPSILSSVKQASATVDRFTLLDDKEKSMKEELPRRMESAVTLIGNISKTEMSMAEIKQEEASLIEQISRLQDELNNTERRKRECEARLSSLQEQKNKCIAETKEFKKEFESVKEDKSQMIEDHRKAQQKLFKVNNKWSALCSQFEQNHSATRSLS